MLQCENCSLAVSLFLEVLRQEVFVGARFISPYEGKIEQIFKIEENKKENKMNFMRRVGLSIALLLCFMNKGEGDMLDMYRADLKDSYSQKNQTREKICLNGLWKIYLTDIFSQADYSDEAFGYTLVPSSWVHETDFPIYGSDKFKAGVYNGQGSWSGKSVKDYSLAWYTRKFSVPADWKNRDIFLKFDRITMSGTIFLNGKELGSQNERDDKSYKINEYLVSGENLLEVRVAAFLDEEIELSLGAEMTRTIKAKANLRGITQDVWLYALPKELVVENVFVKTSFRNKEISVDVTVENKAGKKGDIELIAKILDEESGKEVKELSLKGKVNGSKKQVFTISEKWDNPVLWETDNPHLYQVVVEVKDSGQIIDETFPINFGFKEMWIEGRNVLLNGKPFHFRTVHIGSHDAFVNTALYNAKQKLELYRAAGFNSLQLGSEGVWRAGHSAQFYDEIIDYADRNGLPVLLPLNPVNSLDITQKAILEPWQESVESIMKLYRNHPSVAMWSLNFNYLGYPWDSSPHTMGSTYAPEDNVNFFGKRKERAAISEAFVRELDPTRIVYHHAGGNYGEMSTANFYIAWPPLQEREDYFSKWSSDGIKPFFAVELGHPSVLDFLRARVGNYMTVRYSEILETEYSAPYLGPEAYRLQKDDYIKLMSDGATDEQTANADKYNVNNTYFWKYRMTVHEPVKTLREMLFPAYMKSWRTYGLTGFSPNGGTVEIQGRDYPREGGVIGEYKYEDLTAPGAKPQTYYIPRDIPQTETSKVYAKSQKDLLVYVAGSQQNGFSSKDHAFYAGEKIDKQIAIVNDLRKDQQLEIVWSLVDKDAKVISTGAVKADTKVGTADLMPVSIEAPEVDKKTSYTIRLDVKGADTSKLGLYDFKLQVFPKQELKVSKKTGLFDPIGDTKAAFDRIGFAYKEIKSDGDLDNLDVIIIGRSSLKESDEILESILSKVSNGAYLICMSQEKLEQFGLRTFKRGVRRAFILGNEFSDSDLTNEDFADWRGESTMVDPYPEQAKTEEDRYPEEPWKWGNKGTISSYIIEKPHAGNGRALLECEFDLGYSPLMEFKEGKSKIFFSQLDLTDRLGIDPVASIVFEEILNKAVEESDQLSAVYGYDNDSIKKLKELGAVISDKLNDSKVAVWSGEELSSARQQEMIEFIKAGGTLIVVGQKPLENLSWLPMKVDLKQELFYRAEPLNQSGLMQGISISDLFIKDEVNEKVVASIENGRILAKPGILAEMNIGDGKVIFFTVDIDNYKNSKITPERMNRIYTKLNRILSVLISNSGGKFRGLQDKYVSSNILPDIPLAGRWRFEIDPENRGRRKSWYKSSFDDSNWRMLDVPGYWESQGVTDYNPDFPDAKRPYDGYAWYRSEVFISNKYKTEELSMMLGAVDDMDATYFNGFKIGQTGTETPEYYAFVRDYKIPGDIIKFGEKNSIAVRVYDNTGFGGIVGPKLYLHTKNYDSYPYVNEETPFNPYILKRW